MSALDRIRPYSIPKIAEACVAAGFYVTYKQRRSKPALLQALALASEEDLEAIEDAMQDPGQKRKRPGSPDDNHRPVKRRHVADPSEKFMEVPSDETLEKCVAKYIDSTNNAALSKSICLSCARLMFSKTMVRININAIEHLDVLKPVERHAAHNLIDGKLVCREAVGCNGETHVCSECYRFLSKGALPPLSLANNMWVGEVPVELRVLTLPERILIAKYIPTAYIVTLIPKAASARFYNADTLNVGLKGNVATYPLNSEEIQGMVDGKLLPHGVQILAATIGVTFIGPTNLPSRMLPDMFLVRRSRVKRALEWLKRNNPIYANVVLSEERLNELPECDVPPEILETAKYSPDLIGYQREHAGYVPEEDMQEEPEGGHDGWVFRHGDERGRVEEEIAPVVVQLHTNGVVDLAGNTVPDSELLAHALSNTAEESQDLPKFKVAHGSAFVNEYARIDDSTKKRFDGGPENASHLLGSFPCLFPYGQGGFEVGRAIDVPYETHAKWALQYHDKRFRQDVHFAFQLFNVIQKRQVCRGARIEIPKVEFRKHERQIMALKPQDLLQASQEEARRVPFSNPAVRSLRKVITAVRKGVIGTNESRQKIKGKIWGTCVLHGPPSLWITLNPSDTQDPIAQVLTGVKIDMDKFEKTAGVDVAERGKRISKDPYAAAEFFHLVIKIVLEEIMGISSYKGRVKRETGIFGRVQSYVGAVEAQGRGALHLHMLVWLEHAPTAKEMQEKLQNADFRAKLLNFIATHIRADLDGANDRAVSAMKKENQVSFRRPVDPRKGHYNVAWKVQQAQLVRALQYHTCSVGSCLKVVRKEMVCKRGAPWPLARDDWIEPDGNWGPKRSCGYLNNWNPIILNCGGFNHDIKLLTNGEETQSVAVYLTNYTSKGQPRSSNVCGLVATRMMNESTRKKRMEETVARNQRMIQMCANALNRDQEISGPMAMSLLMGWGDTFESHFYVSIYLGGAVAALLRRYPQLAVKSYTEEVISQHADGEIAEHTEVNEQQETARVGMEGGQVVLKNQLRDYQIRGDRLESYSYLDFMLKTYEGPRVEEKGDGEAAIGLRSERVNYKGGYGKDARCRIVRQPGQEAVPHFVGNWFARSDREEVKELYCAQIMMLFRPWRSMEDLKEEGTTFEQTWKKFMEGAGQEVRRMTENIQYYYESGDGASRDAQRRREEMAVLEEMSDDEMVGEGDYEEIDLGEANITEDSIDVEREKVNSAADVEFAREAMEIAHRCGIFKPVQVEGKGKMLRKAGTEELTVFASWQKSLRTMMRDEAVLAGSDLDNIAARVTEDDGGARSAFVSFVDHEGTTTRPPRPKLGMLNDDQRRAHDIIEQHLLDMLKGRTTEQLLMLVLGAGGTGKSLLISAITETFEYHGARDKLAKTASSGVAASLIGGRTLHSWAGIPIGTKGAIDITKAGKAVQQKRAKNINGTEYLVHDEAWMNGKSILGLLSEITGQVRAHDGKAPTGLPFGGLNVIMFGDPHQFPPVRDPGGALYCHRPETDKQRAALGRELYLQFTKVVVLKEQKRIQDGVWNKVLNDLRVGECDAEDLEAIEQVVLTNEGCITTDFTKEPWTEAVLVTPRHAVRDKWNKAALARHCAKTGHCVYVSGAEDTHSGTKRQLTMSERHMIASIKPQDTGKLEERVHLAVGMRAMVVVNIATEADVANGTRGVITDIVLDPRENVVAGKAGEEVLLRYPPAVIHFKPDVPKDVQFAGLPKGIIPISPTETTFTIKRKGQKHTIKRRQLAVTAGYAFTDYRAQGQTLEYVIIDLGKPPRGGLTPFSAYVALSRSRGRKTIRILRNGPDELFTTHPSADLAKEDKRLEMLDKLTRRPEIRN